nr:hypothetical protein [Tanacetum cinerariifolium]
MDAMTLKMDAQYKELQSNVKKAKPDPDEDDIPMSREEAKFMQTFRRTLSVGWQSLQSGGWVLAGEIILLNHSFKALVRVMLGRGSSYFTISSLQLDL